MVVVQHRLVTLARWTSEQSCSSFLFPAAEGAQSRKRLTGQCDCHSAAGSEILASGQQVGGTELHSGRAKERLAIFSR